MKLNKIKPVNVNCAYKIKNIKQNNRKIYNRPAQNTLEYSSDNLKANYFLNFKGNLDFEILKEDSSKILNHQTHFFREPKTDEIVQNYVLTKFSNEPEINIVSGACSSGEEAKSYAMMLDFLGNRLSVFGFDISQGVINKAKSNVAGLIVSTNISDSIPDETFLIGDSSNLTSYQKQCRQKFEEYYNKTKEPYIKQIDSKAQEEYEKLKRELQVRLNYEKEINPNFDYDDFFNTDKEIAKITSKLYTLGLQMDSYTLQDYKEKDGAFSNCFFEQGDVLNLAKLYKPNSINVLLYRNALYHTLLRNRNSLIPQKQKDASEKMDFIAGQMNGILKKDGLVVYGEKEYKQLNFMDNITDIIKESMENNGFRKYIYNGKEIDNIWVKVDA